MSELDLKDSSILLMIAMHGQHANVYESIGNIIDPAKLNTLLTIPEQDEQEDDNLPSKIAHFVEKGMITATRFDEPFCFFAVQFTQKGLETAQQFEATPYGHGQQ